jgi:hypothetical protein
MGFDSSALRNMEFEEFLVSELHKYLEDHGIRLEDGLLIVNDNVIGGNLRIEGDKIKIYLRKGFSGAGVQEVILLADPSSFDQLVKVVKHGI